MASFFMSLENLSFSIWLNESSSVWAFPMFLFMHTLGMSIVAGGSAVINLAVLGVWPKTPIKPLQRLFPILIWGFALNAFTGVSIFMKDATSYGFNLDFYVKMVFVFAGMALLLKIRKQVFGDPQLDNGPVSSKAKLLAWASLFCWFAAIVAGRLIAYVGPVAGL
jgi:hypothetical protein